MFSKSQETSMTFRYTRSGGLRSVPPSKRVQFTPYPKAKAGLPPCPNPRLRRRLGGKVEGNLSRGPRKGDRQFARKDLWPRTECRPVPLHPGLPETTFRPSPAHGTRPGSRSRGIPFRQSTAESNQLSWMRCIFPVPHLAPRQHRVHALAAPAERTSQLHVNRMRRAMRTQQVPRHQRPEGISVP